MYQRILVPTDGSALSKKAVRSAITLAQTTGAELFALHVVPRVPSSFFDGGGVGVNPAEVAKTEKRWADKGRALADTVVALAKADGVKARTVVVKSDLVAEAVLASASKHNCDLIVMASHGRKGLKRLLLGSETQHVLTHGTIPVLVLR